MSDHVHDWDTLTTHTPTDACCATYHIECVRCCSCGICPTDQHSVAAAPKVAQPVPKGG